MDLQAIFEAIDNAGRDTRKQYHLTLGKLIDYLEEEYNNGNGDWKVILDSNCITVGYPEYFKRDQEIGLDVLDSYRGYYEDLAFTVFSDKSSDDSVECLYYYLKSTLNEIFYGYKGGEYPAHRDSVLWISRYGYCDGVAIVGIKKDENNKRYLVQTKLIED